MKKSFKIGQLVISFSIEQQTKRQQANRWWLDEVKMNNGQMPLRKYTLDKLHKIGYSHDMAIITAMSLRHMSGHLNCPFI